MARRSVISAYHPVRGQVFAVVDEETWLPYFGVLCSTPAVAAMGPFACKEAAEKVLAAAGARLGQWANF